MNRIWNYDGIEVVHTGSETDADPCFVGYARAPRYYVWRAYPTPHGYRVTLHDDTDRLHTVQGATMNLALEVAQAVFKHGNAK